MRAHDVLRALILALLLSPAACSDKGGGTGPVTPTPPDPGKPVSIAVNPIADSIPFGQQLQFAATLKSAAGTVVSGFPITWASSDTAVATVDAQGLATGRRPGQVTISAAYSSLSASATLRVKALPPKLVLHLPSAMYFGDRLKLASLVEVTDSLGRRLDPPPVAFQLTDTMTVKFLNTNGQGNPQLYARHAGTAEIQVKYDSLVAKASVTVSAVTYVRATVRCALTVDGRTLCWGPGYVGALGDGPDWVGSAYNPQVVYGNHHFVAVGRGVFYGCGLESGGDVYCWGENERGELGDPSMTTDCSNSSTPFYCSGAPIRVAGGVSFRSISVSLQWTCGVSRSDIAYCWGFNGTAQLGAPSSGMCTIASWYSGYIPPVAMPCSRQPVPVSGGLRFKNVSTAGWLFGGTACGVTYDGSAYCWGAGNYFADPSTLDRCAYVLARATADTVPCAMQPIRIQAPVAFDTVASGPHGACALTIDGSAYCWGDPPVPGFRTISDILTPRILPGGLHFRAITVDATVACGIAVDGKGYCWGYGGNGELGNGASTDAQVPVPVSLGSLVSIDARQAQVCAVTTGGKVFCWGSIAFDAYDEAPTKYFSPVEVPNGLDVPPPPQSTRAVPSEGGLRDVVLTAHVRGSVGWGRR